MQSTPGSPLIPLILLEYLKPGRGHYVCGSANRPLNAAPKTAAFRLLLVLKTEYRRLLRSATVYVLCRLYLCFYMLSCGSVLGTE